jgi:hypothetical protein
MRLDLRRSLCAGLCAAASSIAHAGGPLYIHAETMRPVAYPNATPVRVYTDLGKLGVLDNQAIGAQVANAFAQWTNVETADFEATIAGDFATIGLPDIVAQNAASVIGKDNGGGIHVIYDDDGSLLKNFLGADDSVLGMATPEFGIGPVVTESWVVLNGVPTAFGSSANYVGVVTHEAGHSIGLAHSQANGESAWWTEEPAPYACTAPWSGRPSYATVETMHPTITLWATGLAMGSVDMLDDRAALSNLYPAAGWPASGASIHGRILGLDGTTELTGVNVIARNLDDPFADAISVISGDHTQGRAAPDGRFALNGLTPGARYVVYTDMLKRRNYSTPAAILYYGNHSEEYWNAAESGDGTADARCEHTPLQVTAGTVREADIVINRPEQEHLLRAVPVPGFTVTDLSDDRRVLVGQMIVGATSRPAAARWTEADGIQIVPGSKETGGDVRVNAAGDVMFAQIADENGVSWASRWRVGDATATRLTGGLAIGKCDDSGSSLYDIGQDGRIVVGLAYRGSPCKSPFAFRWTESTGFQSLGGLGPWTRATAISEDGSTIVGWNDQHAVFAGRQGVWWHRGRQAFASPSPGAPAGFWSEAHDVSLDGNVIAGALAGKDRRPWIATRTGERRLLGILEVPAVRGNGSGGYVTVLSSDGRAAFGFWGLGFDRRQFVWTEALGLVDLAEFLHAQGADHASTFTFAAPTGLTPDDKFLVGFGYAGAMPISWTSQLDTVAVCTSTLETRYVDFPKGMDDALLDGARAGRCDRPEPQPSQ